jgi:tetratricopeptide (TPR) repeat protein
VYRVEVDPAFHSTIGTACYTDGECHPCTLCSYSFIAPRDDEKTYDMHRLVHVAARVWAREDGAMAETQKTALEHLCDIFPSDDYKNRGVWREYIPHASRIRDAKDCNNSDALGKLCLKVGRCLRVDGRIRDAVDWLEESRDLRADLPEDDADRLLTQHVLAMAYQSNGQVKDAVRLLEHVVAIHKRALAEDHPDRLASQHQLASAYLANGQVKDAVRLLEHVVAISERVLAEDHPSRLASQHELARAYRADKPLNQLESHPLSQADEHGAGSSRPSRSTARLKGTLPRRPPKTGAPVHNHLSQVKDEEESVRGKFTKFCRKLQRK